MKLSIVSATTLKTQKVDKADKVKDKKIEVLSVSPAAATLNLSCDPPVALTLTGILPDGTTIANPPVTYTVTPDNGLAQLVATPAGYSTVKSLL